jgi:hypothetical protein
MQMDKEQSRGLFIGTELLALLAGITLAKFDTAQTIFLIIGTVSSVLTIIMLSLPQMKRHDQKKNTNSTTEVLIAC